MLSPILTYKHAGLYVEIRYDELAGDPRREFENLGTIVGWQDTRLRLGDRQLSVECTDPSELVAEMRQQDARIILPVYYTSHGPQCKLDIGNCADRDSIESSSGVIYVTAARLRSEYGLKRISAKAIGTAIAVLRSEIAEYSAYLNGDVYRFIIKDTDLVQLDSGWGFYDRADCESAGNSVAERCAEQQTAEAHEAFEMSCRGIQTIRAQPAGSSRGAGSQKDTPRLLQPRDFSRLGDTLAAGIPTGIDNDGWGGTRR